MNTVFTASTHDYILFFTDKGRVFRKKGYEIPRHAVVGGDQQILTAISLPDLDQLVALFQHNGLKADLPDIVIFPDRCLLHHTAAGGHQQEVGVAVAADRNNGGNLLYLFRINISGEKLTLRHSRRGKVFWPRPRRIWELSCCFWCAVCAG